MSIEEKLIQIIGIVFILYFCIRTLIFSTIQAYKEIYIEIHQSTQEIKEKNLPYEIEMEIEKLAKSK